jgi:putative phosphoribosyl transferase
MDTSPTGCLEEEVAMTIDGSIGVRRAADEQSSAVRVRVDVGTVLEAQLTVPPGACGLVVVAHSGCTRREGEQDATVVRLLNGAGLGTLLLDLLTPDEAVYRLHEFDLPLLAQRLRAATSWLLKQPGLGSLPVAWFGTSTAAGAALWAAAVPGEQVAAVVAHGGFPDLAGDRLAEVRVPTLLVVGALDQFRLERNRWALEQLGATAELFAVRGAGGQFADTTLLRESVEVARRWLRTHLRATTHLPATQPADVAHRRGAA